MAAVHRSVGPSPRLAFVLVAAGLVLRFATLGRQSFWLDEAFCVWVATQHSAHAIWTRRLDPNEPATYFLMLRWFLHVTGVSEAAARLPSALSSAAGLGLVYGIGRRLAPGTAVGRLAAVLLALAPIDVWYAQEARMHGMVATLGLVLASGLLADAWWGALLVAAGLAGGLYLDHTMWPIAVVLVSGWAVMWWHRGRPIGSLLEVGAGAAAAAVLYRPIWPLAADVYSRLNSVPFFVNLRRALGLPVLALPSLAATLAIAAVACTGVLAVIWRAIADARTRRRVQRLLVAGFLAATAFTAVGRFYGLKQILVCGWPILILAVAWAIVSIDRRQTAADAGRVRQGGAWRLAVGVSLGALAFSLTTSRADWRGVAAYLQAHAGPQTVVILDPTSNDLPYSYYRPGAPVVRGPVASLDPVLAARPDASEACLVAERFGSAPPTSPSEAWLDRNLTLAAATPFSRLELRCYRVR